MLPKSRVRSSQASAVTLLPTAAEAEPEAEAATALDVDGTLASIAVGGDAVGLSLTRVSLCFAGRFTIDAAPAASFWLLVVAVAVIVVLGVASSMCVRELNALTSGSRHDRELR